MSAMPLLALELVQVSMLQVAPVDATVQGVVAVELMRVALLQRTPRTMSAMNRALTLRLAHERAVAAELSERVEAAEARAEEAELEQEYCGGAAEDLQRDFDALRTALGLNLHVLRDVPADVALINELRRSRIAIEGALSSVRGLDETNSVEERVVELVLVRRVDETVLTNLLSRHPG